MCGSIITTSFLPFAFSLSCITSGVGNALGSHVKYRFPSVCSISNQITSYLKLSMILFRYRAIRKDTECYMYQNCHPPYERPLHRDNSTCIDGTQLKTIVALPQFLLVMHIYSNQFFFFFVTITCVYWENTSYGEGPIKKNKSRTPLSAIQCVFLRGRPYNRKNKIFQ